MEIKVFGSGCARCAQTEDIMKIAVAQLKLDADIMHVSDIVEIAKNGIMSTPAVMIDGEIKSAGRIPSMDEVKGWLGGGCCKCGEC